jgi:hypothetical protein
MNLAVNERIFEFNKDDATQVQVEAVAIGPSNDLIDMNYTFENKDIISNYGMVIQKKLRTVSEWIRAPSE